MKICNDKRIPNFRNEEVNPSDRFLFAQFRSFTNVPSFRMMKLGYKRGYKEMTDNWPFQIEMACVFNGEGKLTWREKHRGGNCPPFRGGVKGEVERGWMRPRVFSPGSNRQKPLKRAENAVELMRRELVHQRYGKSRLARVRWFVLIKI